MSKILGGWNIKVSSGLPEQVATAYFNILGNLLGAQYTSIAYLGSQVVNGTNHAILSEQIVTTGVDTRNVVLVILNEKPGSIAGKDFALVSITPIVEGGGKFGGTNIDVKTDIPEDIMAVFNGAFEGFVGSNVVPFAFIGTKVVKGVEYKFAATVSPVVPNPTTTVQIVTVNGLTKEVKFEPVL